MNPYDVILAGGGLSGRTLALELIAQPAFQHKKILLIDRDAKDRNDRTWCFWAADEADIPPFAHKTWTNCLFYGEKWSRSLQMPPYRYVMVRGIDFYSWSAAQLDAAPQIAQIQTNIRHIHPDGRVETDAGTFQAEWVFNSALAPLPLLPQDPPPPYTFQNQALPPQYTWFLQHFKGWIVETPHPAFDHDTATLMDFRVDQAGDTRFVYVLPFSENRALVEYTIFSPQLCPPEDYDAALRAYLRDFLNVEQYTVAETEFGVIPMTDYPFSPKQTGRVVHIGTVGGFVKGSSGYAFKRTRRKLRHFVQDWAASGTPHPQLLASAYRFRLYDSIMLQVLREKWYPGRQFFTDLFQKQPATRIFRFLDEESTFAEELQVMYTPPSRPFLKAVWRRIPHMHRL